MPWFAAAGRASREGAEGPIYHRLMVHLPLLDAAYLHKVIASVLPCPRPHLSPPS
jgi:hypothetical protein